MITPTKADIGRRVLYTGNTHPGGEIEEGVLTAFNDTCAFVRYGTRLTPQGTNLSDLEWDGPPAAEPPAPSPTPHAGLEDLFKACLELVGLICMYKEMPGKATARELCKALQKAYELELAGDAAMGMMCFLGEEWGVVDEAGEVVEG